MIKITKYDPTYEDALRKMMTMEGMNFKDVELCLDTLFVVVERDQVLGFGYYNKYNEDFFLDHLYIRSDERLNKLGDSLFRALLNSLYLQGVLQVRMRDDQRYRAFLQYEEIPLEDDGYHIDLTAFFNRKCKSEKAQKTPLQ